MAKAAAVNVWRPIFHH